MRQHDLERSLSQIPPHPRPRADLEQYATPADVAAPLLFEALALGDLREKSVVDLGAGTGILAIGAALLGAHPVVGVELDASAVGVARTFAQRLGAEVEFVVADVADRQQTADTVIMNPPFGAQTRGADRAFLDAAFRTAPVVYTMHNGSTRRFVGSYAAARGFTASHHWAMKIALRHQFAHQSRPLAEIDVIGLRLVKGKD